MHHALTRGRRRGTFKRSLHCYEGRFENLAETFILDVYVLEDELYLSLNGYRKEKHKLYYYDGDTLSFEMGYLDCLKREMWPKTYEGYYLLEFVAAEDADIRVVIWRAVPQGELFVRRSRTSVVGRDSVSVITRSAAG